MLVPDGPRSLSSFMSMYIYIYYVYLLLPGIRGLTRATRPARLLRAYEGSEVR